MTGSIIIKEHNRNILKLAANDWYIVITRIEESLFKRTVYFTAIKFYKYTLIKQSIATFSTFHAISNVIHAK